jgi:hypothetical protein
MNATRKIFRLTGHTKLIAGANWNNGSNSGSRSRNANNWRWNTNSNIGRQFAADPGGVILLAGSVGLVSGYTGSKTHNGGAGGLVTCCEHHPVRVNA